MKKYLKLLYGAMGLVGLLLTSCSEDIVDREASYVPGDNVMQVYFTAANPGFMEVEPVVNSVSIEIARQETAAAAQVGIMSYDTAGVFTVPEFVSFEAGEEIGTIEISFADLEVFESYMLRLVLDESETNPYVEVDGTQEFVLRVMQSDWADVAQGSYYSDFFEDTWDQALQYSVLLDRYRFPSVWFDGFHFEFLWDGESADVAPFRASFPTGYDHPTYGMIYAEVASEPGVEDSYYDAAENQLVFDVGWVVPGLGSFGNFPEIFTITSE
ncbi:hypothetical protein [Geofilum rubicundum]|uniref:DUF4843 domain-containing protein n=1 Tax=Geofilum rubicundum JCM 15548 TaxID=1236989 RepID=A0A0E9M2X0_9BACT|nr:hypothetical protein [Geofilum rubicundum]GAO31495.1 hypothetical protein JCM15548_13860 [Geofilum rubicundum JCM 15548]